jgi:hypothetical protein
MNDRAAAIVYFTPGAGYERTGEDYVKTPDMRIVDVLSGLAGKNNKIWVKVRYAKIQELLFKFTGRRLSVRSLARHLGALERDNYIRRQRLHETGWAGELVLRASLYVLRRRSVQRARNLASNVWKWSTAAAKSLMTLPMPILAETLTPSGHTYQKQRRRAPPKR